MASMPGAITYVQSRQGKSQMKQREDAEDAEE
jgi:hypothetical protein